MKIFHLQKCNSGDVYDATTQEVIRLLEENDSSVKAIKISIDPMYIMPDSLLTNEEMEQAGRAIAQNKVVDTLVICISHGLQYGKPDFNSRLSRFFDCMSENQSICQLECSSSGGGRKIEPLLSLRSFFANNEKLESVRLFDWKITPEAMRSFATFLANRRSPIESLCLRKCRLGDAGVKELISVFLDHPKMIPKKICLRKNSMRDESCSYISQVLFNTGLEEIDLGENNFFTPRGLKSIGTALAGRRSGFRRLELTDNSMRNKHFLTITEAIGTRLDLIPSELDFRGNSIGVEGAKSLSRILSRRKFPINELNLAENGRKGKTRISSLLEGFLANPALTPRYLNVNYCNVREEDYFLFARLLRHPNCSLEKLDIGYNSPHSLEALTILVDCLKNNTTLREMHLSDCLPDDPWSLLLPLICNTTTISETYKSNHSLVYFKCQDYNSNYFKRNKYQNNNVAKILDMNNNTDKKAVATRKVIEEHFAYNFDTKHFEEMEASLLAGVFSFVNQGFMLRDNNSFSARDDANHRDTQREEETIEAKRLRANNNLTINFLLIRNNMPALLGYVSPRIDRKGEKKN